MGLVEPFDKHASPVMNKEGGPSGGRATDSTRRFAFAMRALGRTPVSLCYQDRDLVYEWVENFIEGIAPEDVIGHTDDDFMPRLAADRLRATKLHVIETREAQRFELPVNIGGQVRWFDVWIDPDLGPSGAPMGVFSTIIDVSVQKRREVQLKNLLREVSHRSRNLLAIVLSLASQTARSATSVPSFVTAFSGRLQSIARAQDLVTDRDWQGALLGDLIERQVALFHRDHALPVVVRGDDLVISPNAALYVGLAIHELAAMAVKNGQLANDKGQISIHFQQVPRSDGGRNLEIAWTEHFGFGQSGDEVEALTRKFLESVVPLAVDGTAELHALGKGIDYTLRIDGRHIC